MPAHAASAPALAPAPVDRHHPGARLAVWLFAGGFAAALALRSIVPGRRRGLLAVAGLVLSCAASRAGPARADGAGEAIVMIVHRDNPHPVDRAFVQRVYTGALRGWPDNSPVFALDLDERDPVRLAFLQSVIGRSAASMKAIWSQNIFTGKGYPPRQAEPGADMRRLVAANRNALGYLRAVDADESVRVIRL